MAHAASHRLAIVTGAGSGLGRAFCRRLAAQGSWHVVATDLELARAEETRDLVVRRGGSAEARQLDVADPDAWVAVREQLRQSFPRLDLLVNNAGVCMAAEAGQGELASWRRITEVNFFGVLHGCQLLVPWLRESALQPGPPPAVINVASIAAWLAPPSMGAYSASKAAVVAFTEALHAELRQRGVHVTVAVPGFFASDLLAAGTFATPELARHAQELADSSRITADEVATAALRAAERGRLYAILGRRARWLARLKRLAPGLLVRMLGARYARRHGAPEEGTGLTPCASKSLPRRLPSPLQD